MKKLSFIMAVLMMLMCMPVVAMTSVSATEPATEADPIVDLTIPEGTTVEEANAVGYVLDNGDKVYVDTLAHASDIARANIGTQVILYLTKNYEATTTIGYAYSGCEVVDLSGGADLLIDGQGNSIVNANNAASNPGRLFRFDNGDGTGKLGFRNITLNTGEGKAGGCVEFGNNSLSFLYMKDVTLVIPTTNAYGFVVKCSAELDNVTRDCVGKNGMHIVGSGTEITVKNSNFSNAASMFVSDQTGDFDLTIDNVTVSNVTYHVFDKMNADITINSGTFSSNSGIFDVINGNIVINGGTFTAAKYLAKLTKGNKSFTVNGGTFNDCSDSSSAVFNITSSNNTINLYKGTFNIATHALVRIGSNTSNNNVVNVYDGTYTIATPVNQIGIFDEPSASDNNTYNIYDGTFTMEGTGGRMFVFNGGSTNTKLNISGGIFSAYKNIFSLRNAPNLNVAINGGVFTTTNGADEMFWLDNGAAKTITINGGTFNALNRTGEATDDTIKGTAGDYAQGINGIIYSVSAGAAITVNGGTFNLYGENDETVVDDGVHILTRGNAKSVTVLGGTFNGGQYVNVHAPKVDLSAATKAEMPESKTVTLNPTTTKGASVRTDPETSGIRFQGTVSKYSMDFLKTFYADADVYCGIAIVPEDYLDETDGEFTFAALEAAELTWATTNAVDGLVDNGDGTYTVRIALVGIKDSNLTRNFVAIAYTYADIDGDGKVTANDVVIYADEYSNERNIVDTAKAALADVQPESGIYGESLYGTLVTGYYYVEENDGTFTKVELAENEVKYSKYSAAQLEVLKKYA